MLVVLAFAATSIGVLSLPSTTLAWSANTFNSSSERQLVSLTNQARASAGLRSLRVDSTLTAIARSRSKDMIVRNYFSHNIPPSGYLVFHILDTKGYCYKIAGENIGWNTYPDDVATAEIQGAFMGSSGHRANILGKAWDVIGIGAYKGPDGKKMWTVLFADKCGSTSTAPKPTPKPTREAQAAGHPEADAEADSEAEAHPKPTPKPVVAAASPSPAPSLTPPIPSEPAGTRRDRAAGPVAVRRRRPRGRQRAGRDRPRRRPVHVGGEPPRHRTARLAGAARHDRLRGHGVPPRRLTRRSRGR